MAKRQHCVIFGAMMTWKIYTGIFALKWIIHEIYCIVYYYNLEEKYTATISQTIYYIFLIWLWQQVWIIFYTKPLSSKMNYKCYKIQLIFYNAVCGWFFLATKCRHLLSIYLSMLPILHETMKFYMYVVVCTNNLCMVSLFGNY